MLSSFYDTRFVRPSEKTTHSSILTKGSIIPNTVNIKEKFNLFADHWSPKIVGSLNQQHVKFAKFLGEFDWHHHENEDELFWVIQGELLIQFRDRDVVVREGEFLIVPKGVEHKPVAKEEVHVVLFEPATTLNTGNTTTKHTVEQLETL